MIATHTTPAAIDKAITAALGPKPTNPDSLALYLQCRAAFCLNAAAEAAQRAEAALAARNLKRATALHATAQQFMNEHRSLTA